MLERLLAFSIRRRWIVLATTAAAALFGAFSFSRLRIDAVPDITTVQVQVNTVVEGLTPEEVEQQITFPIETAMAGIPDVEETRSLSRYGLSQVTVVFRDGTDVYFARQRVNERLQEARPDLPTDVNPEMGPIATALGEIFRWIVEAKPGALKPDGTPYTPTDLREIQDWVIKPQMRNVPGITEIASMGGYRRQYHVTPDPNRLVAYGVSFQDVIRALEENNTVAGGGFVEHKGEQYLVSMAGRLQSEDDLKGVVVATHHGVPIRVQDIATVGEGLELRGGAATERGQEIVLGTAMMLIGENSRTVSERAERKLAEVNRSLPPGVTARAVYSRSKLVNETIGTVRTNLILGATLVTGILFLLLGNFIGAIIVALVIPLSLLFAISGMVEWKISANLLSLGAVDFGIIVDGAVVMIENIVRRTGARERELGRPPTHEERLAEIQAAAREMARPTLTGVGIIMIVYLPILTLAGLEGKMFRPMAQVVLLALTGALVLTFTFVPAAAAALVGHGLSERQSRAIRAARRAYEPALNWVLARSRAVLVGAILLVVACGVLGARLGSEFVPTLDEQDLLIIIAHIPGTSLEQTLTMERGIEKTIETVPEVANVFAQIGTADVANDPMPPSSGDIFIILKPRHDWPHPGKSKETLIHEIEAKIELLPGNIYEFSQPIEDRFNELIAGARSDVAVKIFGDDLEVLRATAGRVSRALSDVRGAADVSVEQTAGLPMLTIQIDRAAAARYGLSVADIQSTIHTALAGSEVGEMLQGDRRAAIVVRLPEAVRTDLNALSSLPVATPAIANEGPASFVPLGTVSHIALTEGPNEIQRENGKRLIVVQANVRGRDLGGYVDQAQQKVGQIAKIPAGYWLDWGGQFKNLFAARKRLAFVVPIALLLIFLLLLSAFGSVKDALLVFTGVPFALTGGVLALAVRGLPFSITAAVGFIALSGVAVLNGVVLLSYVRNLRANGMGIAEALREGCSTRLRPVLMTALVASLGFVPMALATGTGAEVQRPLATVVIGGVLSSTLLTLLVLPVLYQMVHRQRHERSTPPP